jgi:DNA gyrase subunit A
VITVTHNGYLKRTPADTYRKQTRGGRGRIGMGTRDDDFLEALFSASTHSYILVFTNLGLMHWLKVYFIPDVGTTGRGKNIVNLVNLQPDEKVQAFLGVREFDEVRYVVMATRKGVIKKCSLSVFDRPSSRGIIALNLDEGDELISVRMTEGNDEILVVTHKGKAIRFHEKGVRPMGRPARGVRSIKLGKDDHVIGMIAVNEEVLSLSVTENGYGKRTKISEYREQSRGGQGVINIKTSARNGNVVAVLDVTADPDIMIITRGGKIIRIGSDKIRKTARSAQGVRLVHLEDGDQIAAACIIQDNGEDEEGDDGANGQQPLLQ